MGSDFLSSPRIAHLVLCELADARIAGGESPSWEIAATTTNAHLTNLTARSPVRKTHIQT